jgi:energy-coupling factor transporter ATP-binding protein EcfA2
MISELKIRNFKSLESVDLKLGHFNLLVGANASGKSNFLDALRFLQGVGNGFGLEEILDGKPPSATNLKWDGIRGGSKFVAFRKKDGSSVEQVKLSGTIFETVLYEVKRSNLGFEFRFLPGTGEFEQWLGTGGQSRGFGIRYLPYGRILEGPESEAPTDPFDLVAKNDAVFYRAMARVFDFDAKNYSRSMKQSDRSPTTREVEEQGELSPESLEPDPKWVDAAHIFGALRDMQPIDPHPDNLRGYSGSQSLSQMGEHGEGFAALIHEIESNGSKPALLEWLRELRPDEVDDIYALEGLNNDFMIAIKEGNREFRAPVLSEGTLRFIALAAAFFQPSMPKVLIIEEIEKGLHPSRLRLLLELMRSQSKRTGTQVFATTHSPTLLNWLTEEDRKTTFVCTRDSDSGATKMRSLAEVPNLEELIKKNYNLDQLFEEGWLESVLHES